MTSARRTAEPPTAPVTTPVNTPTEDTSLALGKLYHLVLLDDDQHTYAYVIEMLAAVFGYGREKAYALAAIVDSTGRVILETAGLAQVTRHQERVHGFGADHRIPTSKGSMSAIIEEAP